MIGSQDSREYQSAVYWCRLSHSSTWVKSVSHSSDGRHSNLSFIVQIINQIKSFECKLYHVIQSSVLFLWLGFPCILCELTLWRNNAEPADILSAPDKNSWMFSSWSCVKSFLRITATGRLGNKDGLCLHPAQFDGVTLKVFGKWEHLGKREEFLIWDWRHLGKKGYFDIGGRFEKVTYVSIVGSDQKWYSIFNRFQENDIWIIQLQITDIFMQVFVSSNLLQSGI